MRCRNVFSPSVGPTIPTCVAPAIQSHFRTSFRMAARLLVPRRSSRRFSTSTILSIIAYIARRRTQLSHSQPAEEGCQSASGLLLKGRTVYFVHVAKTHLQNSIYGIG